MTSWDAMRPKLIPNPQAHRAVPILLAAMAATAAGAALAIGSLITLLGITGLPSTVSDLWEETTWRLILDVAGLYISWSLISNGNNFFGVYRPTGYVMCLGGAVTFVAVVRDLITTAGHLPAAAAALRDPSTAAVIVGSLLAGALLLRAGNALFARSRTYLAQVVADPADLEGLGYSLYLRTFAQDGELARAQRFTGLKRGVRSLFVVELPEELLVADALSDDNTPMIGVGSPGEPAPPVGALRVYLPSADWKPQVRQLIAGARHVVLALGWGEGTLWELREAMRVLPPERLILVVPMEHREYERFRAETSRSLPAALPAYAGRREVRSVVRGLITFSEGWAATFVPVRAYSPLHNSLRVALIFAAWPALRRLGYPPRGVLRWAPGAVG